MNNNMKYEIVTTPKTKKELKKIKQRYEKVLVGNTVKVIQKSFLDYAKNLT